MRKLSSNYSVTYKLLNINKRVILNKNKVACYSELYRTSIKETDILILEDFLSEETSMYSRIYLKRIAKICQLKIILLEENRITVIGFKNKFRLKLFTTLFRILFEAYAEYGKKGLSYSERTKNFFDLYIKKRNRSQYKDMLERLIYCYQKSGCYHGPGHGITITENQKIRVRNIENLIDWKDEGGNMQDFFK